MSPAADGVIRRLDAARQQWWLFTLLTTAVLATCVSFGMLFLFMLIDALYRFSQVPLLVMAGVWLVVTVSLIVLVGRRLARSQRSLEATARRVEAELPEIGSDLINVVQLSSDTKNLDRAFCETAVQDAASRIAEFRFEEAAKRESRWRRFLYCMQTPRDLGEAMAVLVMLIGVAVISGILLPNWGSAANRLMKPWDFVPSVGSVEIVKVTPGNTEILMGANVEVVVEIKNPTGEEHKATLLVTPKDDKESGVPMMPEDKHQQYKLTIPAVLKPFKYRIEVGDTQSSVYSVGVREKPAVQEVEVSYQFPAYLGRQPEKVLQKQADLEAPQFTLAELRIRPTAAVARGYLINEGQQIDGRVDQDGMLLVAKIHLVRNSTFTIHLLNDVGHSDPQPRVNRIHVLPDNPPSVELIKPSRQESAAPGAEVPVTIRATDDHGVGRVKLEMKIKPAEAEPGVAGEGKADDEKGEVAKGAGRNAEEKESGVKPSHSREDGKEGDVKPSHSKEDGKESGAKPPHSKEDGKESGVQPPHSKEDEILPTTVQEWTRFEGSTTVVLQSKLVLSGDRVKPGQTVMVRALAWDKRDIGDFGLDLKAQQAASSWHLIRVISPDKKASAAVEQLEGLRTVLFKMLETQLRARLKSGSILKTQEMGACTALAGEVRTQQVEIQKMAMDLVKTIGENAKQERKQVKQVINQLAVGDMLTAVHQCDELVKVNKLEEFAKPVPALNVTQDRIIAALRKLLDVAREAQTDALAELKKKAASDLPDDTRKKLEEMKNKLDKFLEQQKKIMEASESLAKKPVEDFTKEDEQLIKQLAQAQDDWSKFMKDLHSDLSKLPEQDFANSSMAKELNEIQTELKMAEDALLKKSADIAVPLEQLGYERAEEIKTNMEKWLPDTPDREKWSQEESLSDQDKEAPMAELPGELEDLIGDLMEEEEDVFDEAEDVSSSAIDSADKGVGWDVTDGPISNNSAKGATGNRLPNTNEIAGRSGEGRQGKSSGEFVGDEAVGKGGRKTPARLTPDPYVKGQIKDHSKDNAGGATGGGKESGQGGEGLEGPAPGDKGAREMQRLAGKQAAVRNKAETVDAQFSVTKYHRTDLKKMIEVMSQVERDLKAGRYQNALRQRRVLAEGLGNVKQYMEGEFQARKDTTVNLPGDIQKDILGGMQDPSPPGWEEINRKYFEGLSGSGGAPAGAVPGGMKATSNPQK